MASDPLLHMVIDNRYRIDALLSVGGMGSVYRAHSMFFDERVAIKVPIVLPDKKARGRFLLEAKSTRSIRHPNIIEIKDFGELFDGRPYLVMEFLDGTPLDDLILRSG